MKLYCIYLLRFGLIIIINVESLRLPDYTVKFEDHASFILSLDKFGDEDEDEMIKPADLVAFQSKNGNKNKYDPLHLHVQHYNRRAVDKEQKNYAKLLKMSKKAQKNDFVKLKLIKKVQNNFEKYNLKSENPRGLKELEKSTTDSTDYVVDYHGEYDKSVIVRSSDDSDDEKNFQSVSEEIEEAYDYELFKAEYEQQKNDLLYKNQTFNLTDDGQLEDTPKEFWNQLIQFKKPRNCTQEEIEKFGFKSFECLTFDYQHAIKNKTSMSVLLRRTWHVIKIWFFIYVCIAIPCWCQKGWCCCCFRCDFCFPRRRIKRIREYYNNNPPGKLVEGPEIDPEHPLIYEPTKAEKKAYRKLEKALQRV